MARIVKDRYVAVALGAAVVFLSVVAVALAYTHVTNDTNHGLKSEILGSNQVPWGVTDPPGSQWSGAAVRHYFDDGTWHQQCERYAWGFVDCYGTGWGTAPCQKRYVGGSEGVLSRHWVRLDSSCPGQIHA